MHYYEYLKNALQSDDAQNDPEYWKSLLRDAPPELDKLGDPMDTAYQKARAIVYDLRRRGQQGQPLPEHRPKTFAVFCELFYRLAKNINKATKSDLFNLYLDAVNADLFFSDDACIIKAIIVLSQNEPDIWIDTVACQICGKFQGMTVTAPMTPSARQRLYIIIEESTYND